MQKKGKIRGVMDSFGGADIELSTQAIVDFLTSAKNTLFNQKNSSMLNFLSQTTYPNIREGLRLFKRFLISGHTKVEQYVIRQNIDSKSLIPIPIHEFVKAIALDNKLVYNSNISIVYNLFKPAIGSINHFLKYKILKFLSNFSKNAKGGEKFVLVKKLIEIFTYSGYKKSILYGELTELLNAGLIESQEFISDTDTNLNLTVNDSLTLTFKGFYYVEELANRFHYLELVAQDTPIFNQQNFLKISENFVEADDNGYKSLQNRINFVEAFYEYLCFAETRETIEGENIIKNVMNNIRKNGLQKDINRITNARK